MAETWIKVRHALLRSPKIRQLARQLNCNKNEALGVAVAWLMWVDEQSADGETFLTPAEKPYTSICKIREWLHEYNIEEPRMYAEGFNHANCNGACFKAGLSHWARLYKERPEVYAEQERQEKEWQQATGKDMTICMRKGKQLPLSELRQLVDAGIIEPSYYRLPCACGLVEEQLELNLTHP